METVAGIFLTHEQAEQAVKSLISLGVPEERIVLLSPGTREEEIIAAVPTTETEQPGMGKAMGAAVGGAMGVAGGASLGAAAASLFIPGVGPVIAAGLLAGAVLGTGGAVAGMAIGETIEESLAQGLPHGELYVYEDALRRGRSVVIAFIDDEGIAEQARKQLADTCAESIDAARENWWLGLRDIEEESYKAEGRDFASDELSYRCGFEAAQHANLRNKSYDEVGVNLKDLYPDQAGADAFRRGFERGQAHYRQLREKS